jgi:hypothetical protein
MPKRETLLVFDANDTGHRGNYARIFGAALGCEYLIGPIKLHWQRLFRVETLFLSTFETAPQSFTLLMTARALLGLRTIVILLRPKLTVRSTIKRWLKRCIHMLLADLKRVTLISVMDLSRTHLDGRATAIQDPEFWDLSLREKAVGATALSDRIAQAADGRRILLFPGYLSADKGANFLADAMMRPDWPSDRILVAAIGTQMDDAKPACQLIGQAGGFVHSHLVSDDEFLSLFTITDFAWCCYTPERDMSSGVFGRSVQLGIWPLVSAGSFLDELVGSLQFGAAIPYGDIDALIDVIKEDPPRLEGRPGNPIAEIEQLRRIVFAPDR